MENNIIVTTAYDHFAFGILMDSGDQVYIPSSIVQRFDLHETDVIRAITAPNRNDKSGSVPWFAVYVTQHNSKDVAQQKRKAEPRDEEPAPLPTKRQEMSRYDAIMSVLSDGNVYSSNQIAKMVSHIVGSELTAGDISYYARSLHSEGKIACAEISQKSDAKVGRRYWAGSTAAFTKAFSEVSDDEL